MIEDIRNAALEGGIVDKIIFDKGNHDLYRTVESDGVFCYTFSSQLRRGSEVAGRVVKH
jgi:hypothetical protein